MDRGGEFMESQPAAPCAVEVAVGPMDASVSLNRHWPALEPIIAIPIIVLRREGRVRPTGRAEELGKLAR
jgi:hypothetical protein